MKGEAEMEWIFAKSQQRVNIFGNLYIWVIKQAWGQDGWILAKFFLLRVYGPRRGLLPSENVQKMFGNVRLSFETILENLRKVVGNLGKIVKTKVINMFM